MEKFSGDTPSPTYYYLNNNNVMTNRHLSFSWWGYKEQEAEVMMDRREVDEEHNLLQMSTYLDIHLLSVETRRRIGNFGWNSFT